MRFVCDDRRAAAATLGRWSFAFYEWRGRKNEFALNLCRQYRERSPPTSDIDIVAQANEFRIQNPRASKFYHKRQPLVRHCNLSRCRRSGEPAPSVANIIDPIFHV